ncbi:YitT family protein [Mycoplasma phocimorsus]|uniref:YitT family protein n=1 Tax=Mycoplasma phocimorsus TaxID=3045839 RepID=UPI0024BFA11D|nr:YitT family protein [Mycoplasma phocimorsus]MDJ1647538.1 YitT family protein [Mycoplasma phocimorsus]
MNQLSKSNTKKNSQELKINQIKNKLKYGKKITYFENYLLKKYESTIDIDPENLSNYLLYFNSKEVKKPSLIEIIKHHKINIFMQFVAAILLVCSTNIFLRKAETVPTGYIGIPSLINIGFQGRLTPYLGLLLFALNIPLILGFIKQIKKSFLFLTVMFMIFQTAFGFIFFSHKINGNEQNPILIFLDNYLSFGALIKHEDLANGLVKGAVSPDKEWAIYLYGFIGAFLMGFSIAISWKFGGSTGGSDIIAYYFSTRTKRDVSKVMLLINAITLIIYIWIYIILKLKSPSIDPLLRARPIGGIMVSSLITTICYLFITSGTIRFLYPKYKKVLILIRVTNIERIKAYFKHINYWHHYSIITRINNNEQTEYCVRTVALLLEAKYLIRDIRKIDKTSWISISKLENTYGDFDTSKVD